MQAKILLLVDDWEDIYSSNPYFPTSFTRPGVLCSAIYFVPETYISLNPYFYPALIILVIF